MEENMIGKNMWNGAAKAGLALGALSSVYLLASQLMGRVEMPVLLETFITGILWMVKFCGCIWLMTYFMKRFSIENPEADNRNTRRFGTVTALLSAIVYSAVAFADVAFISADMYDEQITLMLQQMAPMMDSNTMSMMDGYLENLPQITFFSNLIYCFLFGTILSAILSRNIPSRNPFEN